MRNAFADHMINLGKNDTNIFLTGDLGFNALEGVRDSFGERFINCGVSEQNMIGVAAGLAKKGFMVFAYSIAPFIYARPFEQIRNDIMFADLPVCLVGNGGGYAYGYMGPTHHALEDVALMSSLGLDCLVPAFDRDIASMIDSIRKPSYLRLGYEILPEECAAPEYSAWRKLNFGKDKVVIALGPLSGLAWKASFVLEKEQRPDIWSVTDIDSSKIPDSFFKELINKKIYIYEEHVKSGGLGMMLTYEITKRCIPIESIKHRYAESYPKTRFGSQSFHRSENRINIENMITDFQEK